MSDYLTPKAREHFERASAKGCVCGLCELIAALPEILRKAKAQAWAEGITASGINLDWQLHLLDHNPYKEEA